MTYTLFCVAVVCVNSLFIASIVLFTVRREKEEGKKRRKEEEKRKGPPF